MREQSSSPEEDVQSFLDAIAFNWLIAGTDAHAKHYSLLLGQNGVVRLAPLYDLASILPYPAVDTSKVKLAMKVGGEYRLRNIGLRHWQKLAATLRLDDARLIDRIMAMAHAMPDQAAAIQEQIEGHGVSHVTITRFAASLQYGHRHVRRSSNSPNSQKPVLPSARHTDWIVLREPTSQ